MVAFPLLHLSRAALFVATAVLAAAAEKTPAPVHRLLDLNCVDCHDAGEKKGGLDLTTLSFELRDPVVFSRWVQVLDRVEAGEMPPKKRERPEAGELRAFVGELNGTLQATDLARIAREGRVPARRLTRFEYERSLHDLLGTDVPLVDLLPEDARADGFDTVSSAQQVSHHLLEKYLAAIDVALDATFARAFAPVAEQRIELRWPELQQLKPRGREPGPRAEHQDVVAWSVRTAFHGRMPSTRVRESGWYRVTVRVAAVNPPADGEVWCSVRSG
ncbi:MAG TPA: DUF1587 domain-containing protein, partial [Opitutaceae bacterium]|nr:DUF1587 domain-containing protein [Opitutaceae bacterium]